MLIGFTSEQSQLRDATRDLLAGVSSEARVRALMPDPAGSDPAAWRELAGLGLPGIAIPERFGGDGGSLADQGVVLEEMGRVLCGGPYFSTAVLAAQTLLAAPDGDPVATELLEGICAGGLTVTLAVTEAGGRWDEAGVTLPAVPGASGWELTGSKTFVPDGATADVILVPPARPRASACSRCPARRRDWCGCRCRPWTRPASRPGSTSPPPAAA